MIPSSWDADQGLGAWSRFRTLKYSRLCIMVEDDYWITLEEVSKLSLRVIKRFLGFSPELFSKRSRVDFGVLQFGSYLTACENFRLLQAIGI